MKCAVGFLNNQHWPSEIENKHNPTFSGNTKKKIMILFTKLGKKN